MQRRRRLIARIDVSLLLSVTALAVIGLASIYSVTHGTELAVRFQKQAFWTALGGLIFLLIMFAPQRFFHYSAWHFYIAAIIPLILVLFVGKTVAGNKGWFGIGGFGIQPSEFAKVATLLALARFVADSRTSLRSFGDLSKAFGLVALPWILVFIQPDFGTGMVYWAVFLFMIFWGGADMVILMTLVSPVITAVLSVLDLWLFLAFVAAISAMFYILRRNLGIALLFIVLNLVVGFTVQFLYDRLPDYQKDRIAVYLDPSSDPRASGYNVVQSKVAVGAGGLTGSGYLQGSQTQLRFVPEQSTDFIFSVPAEEFGFVGAAVILLLYGTIVFRGIRIARSSVFRFNGILAVGITSMFGFHIFVNIGMVLGLLPVVGLPLPFMSYGGSFLLTSMAGAGLLQHIHSANAQTE